jgi:hypothetical protein
MVPVPVSLGLLWVVSREAEGQQPTTNNTVCGSLFCFVLWDNKKEDGKKAASLFFALD